MDLRLVVKSVESCLDFMNFLGTIAVPPPVMDLTHEGANAVVIEYLVNVLGSLPPPPPSVPRFNILMNLFPQQPPVYHGRNVYGDLIKSPERFWNVTSK